MVDGLSKLMEYFNIYGLEELRCIESKYIEYKKSRKGLSNDIWSTYSAFANTEGGTIYLGIEEKRSRTKKSLFQLVLKIQRK